MSSPLPLPGCRHDVLGHYLKAIGLLRVISTCAEPNHRDPEAEGWWDMDQACFILRSIRYQTPDRLVTLFEDGYRPTPVFSAWNTGGGLAEKKEVVFSIDSSPWVQYWNANRELLLAHGFAPHKGTPKIPDRPFKMQCQSFTLPSTGEIAVTVSAANGNRSKPMIQIAWSRAARLRLFNQLYEKREVLERAINFTKPVVERFREGAAEFVFDLADDAPLSSLSLPGIAVDIQIKESGKKAVMALLAKELSFHPEAADALASGRHFFRRFQEDHADNRLLLETFREQCPRSAVEAFDAIFTTRASGKVADNPLFLKRGDAGAAEVFRSFWVYFLEMRAAPRANTLAALLGIAKGFAVAPRGNGAPFFPDAIKSYNIGSGWLQENYPFYPLDYVLAVEGGYALRGSVARAIGANSGRFAAFPFVFDSGEDLVDDSSNVEATASALYLPLWDRPTTFSELSSFICDSQSRLPGKDARFSAEFVRALNAQGVDAGFSGWQEFRFKMRGSRVPWITTGRYIDGLGRRGPEVQHSRMATTLNLALAPLDESHFLDQFDVILKGNKADSRSPHPVRAAINKAMETAAVEPTAENCLHLLESVFDACRSMCLSESFREKLRGKRASFFAPLPMEEWNRLLAPLEDRPEFRIACALASIAGLRLQGNGDYSAAQPMLGSLLPLKVGHAGLYLPEKADRQQFVWTGEDLSHDLAAVLRRRYLDSLNDDWPALRGACGARLIDVLSFLRGELDDRLIARWTEALSLIGWRFRQDSADDVQIKIRDDEVAIPMAYVALRSLLELECEWQGRDTRLWKKRRSQQPFALMCERSASSLPLAVSDALRWISVWGVPNPWSADSRAEKPRIAGRYIIRLDHDDFSLPTHDQLLSDRLSAAVCIPLVWTDRSQLYRAVTLPPGAD